MYMYTQTSFTELKKGRRQVNKKIIQITKWGYRDGVKSKGDKIGMDYTHGAVYRMNDRITSQA